MVKRKSCYRHPGSNPASNITSMFTPGGLTWAGKAPVFFPAAVRLCLYNYVAKNAFVWISLLLGGSKMPTFYVQQHILYFLSYLNRTGDFFLEKKRTTYGSVFTL